VLYLSTSWALIPVDGYTYIRVNSCVALKDCPECGALAGFPCLSRHGKDWNHYGRGFGKGKTMRADDRLRMAAGLIAAGRYDRIELCDVSAVVKNTQRAGKRDL